MKNTEKYPVLVTVVDGFMGLPLGTKFIYDAKVDMYVANYTEEEFDDDAEYKFSHQVSLSFDSILDNLVTNLKVLVGYGEVEKEDKGANNAEPVCDCNADCKCNDANDEQHNSADIPSDNPMHNIVLTCSLCGSKEALSASEDEILSILISNKNPLVLACKECGNKMELQIS